MVVLDDTRVVKDDEEVDLERVVVEVVDDLVGIDFVEVTVLEVDFRTELESLVVVMPEVVGRVLAGQDLILVLVVVRSDTAQPVVVMVTVEGEQVSVVDVEPLEVIEVISQRTVT